MIDIADILVVTIPDGEVFIRTRTRSGRVLRSLREYEELLIPYGFEKASKSVLVNVDKIWTFCEENQTLYFDKNCELEGVKVSRRNVHKFKGF
ncbi:LytTR family transcriptional regulator [Paenibacillus barcinonensis]|uniref:LytTR family DNA-binding domain-containing protein n=1 Tax=Paenibacillus barcinonensis TaxID=198119 RepID=UPI001C10004B|nr:LytTR family DNA-binding domain-containing protein [Paenibacillus barcinonensis]MBU5356091.1 LytTR family transcriptional regulator [Paenibacillus barcinonensis]